MTLQLPIDEVDEPLQTVKLAEIRGRMQPRVHPIGRFGRRYYEHAEPTSATCHRHHHPAPAVDCSCGFHAVNRVEDLADTTKVFADFLVLDVELSGTVIEHERGYRAEQQSIMRVRFPSTCWRCVAPASHVYAGRTWRSLCADCAGRCRGTTALRRADATALLGIDVAFVDRPREPLRWRRLGVARSIGMVLLTLLTMSVVRIARPPLAINVGSYLCVAASTCLAWATWRVRSARPHDTFFIVQCGCLLVASMLLMASTP